MSPSVGLHPLGARSVKRFPTLSASVQPGFTVKVYRAEEGGYWAECPELPGCFTQGETLVEVRRNARQAMTLYLEALADRLATPPAPARRTRPVARLRFALAPA
jgi:predicted RNase H-like HicB family nuclease